jgi:hypothetical protein
MSSLLRIHVIGEGETDKIVLDAFVEAILGHGEFVSTLIQPETSAAFGNAGQYGGGWKGVLAKCREVRERGGIDAGGYLANADILIIHLDGEVAEEPEIACARPCPPPEDTADALRAAVWSWLDQEPDARVVIAIPMKETEGWVFAALRPQDRLFILCSEPTPEKGPPCLECRDKPSGLLAGGKPRLVISGRKRATKYREVERGLVAGWTNARKLSQAQRFEQDFQSALALVPVSRGMTR